MSCLHILGTTVLIVQASHAGVNNHLSAVPHESKDNKTTRIVGSMRPLHTHRGLQSMTKETSRFGPTARDRGGRSRRCPMDH